MIFHMWTAPSLQGVLQCFDQIACVHMSGLFVRSHMNAGQDGFRDKSFQTEGRPHSGPLENAECLASWIDRSHHLLILASSGIGSARLQLSCLPPCLADL
jgi:hypothetical protein